MALAKYKWTARRLPRGAGGERGFSLLEVLIATSILVVGVASLAQLFTLSTRTNASARTTTFAAVLAQQKMEQLRGLTWGFDSLGLPISDTTTNITTVPETLAGGYGLLPSPAGNLGTTTARSSSFRAGHLLRAAGGGRHAAASARGGRRALQGSRDGRQRRLPGVDVGFAAVQLRASHAVSAGHAQRRSARHVPDRHHHADVRAAHDR